jgi:hypothetical protein
MRGCGWLASGPSLQRMPNGNGVDDKRQRVAWARPQAAVTLPDRSVVGLATIAPRLPLRAGSPAADVWMRKTFADQDLPDVTAADRKNPAEPPIVAAARALLPWPAGTRHPRQARIAGGDEAAKALGSFLSSLALIIAARFVAAFRGIETDQAVHLATGSHGIAVDHLYRARLANFGPDDLNVRRFVSVGPALPTQKGRGRDTGDHCGNDRPEDDRQPGSAAKRNHGGHSLRL